MKRLLLPLLAALALPTAVSAGDLGQADYKTKHLSDKEVRLKVFKGKCGFSFKPLCEIKFKDGKLSVNDSKGITPDQIISFQASEIGLTILYKDSDGIINQANMRLDNRLKKARLLVKEFFYFMNQGKDIPDNYF